MLYSTHYIQLCAKCHLSPLTHSKAIICEGSSSFVLLVEFLFAADGVLHEIHRLWERFVGYQLLKVLRGLMMKNRKTQQREWVHTNRQKKIRA